MNPSTVLSEYYEPAFIKTLEDICLSDEISPQRLLDLGVINKTEKMQLDRRLRTFSYVSVSGVVRDSSPAGARNKTPAVGSPKPSDMPPRRTM